MKISVSAFACPKNQCSYRGLFSPSFADSIHIDIMDGVCVPLTGVSHDTLLELSRSSMLPIQVHLMVYDQVFELGRILAIPSVDMIFLTIEHAPIEQTNACLQMIQESGKKAAVALWPKTDISRIDPFLTNMEMLLVMTTEPGTPQSSFLPNSYNRIQAIFAYLNQKQIQMSVGVDGGMNFERLSKMKLLGVESAVVGRSFFIPQERERLNRLRLSSRRFAQCT